jgi:hypothetical protein
MAGVITLSLAPAANAAELVCGAPKVIFGDQRGDPNPVVSVEVNYNKDRHEWLVFHHLADGSVVARNQQYAMVDGTNASQTRWAGSLNRNPALYMIGAIQNEASGVFYVESLYNRSHGNRLDMQIAARCTPQVASVKPVPITREKYIGEIIWVNGQGGAWRPWKDIVDDFLVLANKHGAEQSDRLCYPEQGRCVNGMTISVKNDAQWKHFSVATWTDVHGTAVMNNVCWWSEQYDIRQCLEYGQSGEGAIEMKGKDGWKEVEPAQAQQQPSPVLPLPDLNKKADRGGI